MVEGRGSRVRLGFVWDMGAAASVFCDVKRAEDLGKMQERGGFRGWDLLGKYNKVRMFVVT